LTAENIADVHVTASSIYCIPQSSNSFVRVSFAKHPFNKVT